MLKHIRTGLIGGLFFATAYSLLVLVIYLLNGSEPFEAKGITLLGTVLIYFAGGIMGGIMVGILHPLTKWRIGAMMVGVLAGVPVCTGFALVIWGHPSAWDPGVLFAIMGTAVILGAWGGYFMWEPPEAQG